MRFSNCVVSFSEVFGILLGEIRNREDLRIIVDLIRFRSYIFSTFLGDSYLHFRVVLKISNIGDSSCGDIVSLGLQMHLTCPLLQLPFFTVIDMVDFHRLKS